MFYRSLLVLFKRKFIEIEIIDNQLNEKNETFFIQLENPIVDSGRHIKLNQFKIVNLFRFVIIY